MRIFVLALLSALTAPAAAVFIDSYNITGAATTGFGGWSHTYTGTITPTGGVAADYTGGSGTLNDTVLATAVSDVQLFDLTLNPVITLFLDGSYFINSLRIYGGANGSNSIPGCITGLTVTFGGSSTTISTTEDGDPGGNCGGVSQLSDEVATILGTILEGLTTTSIELSNFTTSRFDGLFSIAEITVDGDAAATPEPSTMGLIGAGLFGMALLRRRWAR